MVNLNGFTSLLTSNREAVHIVEEVDECENRH